LIIEIYSVLVALTVHEWSHAVTATRLGDPTPHNHGRLTLNPLAHIDPMGALMFVLAGFGWAKPVPVNPLYFRHHRSGMLLTAAAGPFSNLILASVCYAILAFVARVGNVTAWQLLDMPSSGSVGQVFFLRFLGTSLFVNLGLMAFNLIPIAPLDGSKVLAALLPPRLAEQYEEWMQYGMYILLGLLVAERALNLPLLSTWIMTIMDGVLWGLGRIFGQ
jgi:Zn-dependent protease